MGIFDFLLGLGVGLAIWVWQRSRTNARLKNLLRELHSEPEDATFSAASQLALALAQHQRTQQRLEEEIETFRQVLNCTPIGYLQVDDENCLIWCNSQARSLLSIPPEFGATPRLLIELVRSYELDTLIDQTRQQQKPCQQDWTFYPVSPDPSLLSKQQAYVLRGYGFPLMRNQVGIFLENRQEAVTLMQQRDRWASDVAHELKTPLTSIRLVAETLQTRLDPALRGWVDRLISETIRLSNLVQDLLDLAQLDRESSQCLQLKTINLPELIQSAWVNLEPLARKKQIQLNYQGPESLLVQLDEARIYRVLVNLLDNSIKYNPPWENITVKLEAEPSDPPDTPASICLEVIDAGPGFPESALAHIFERFYRADLSRSRSMAELQKYTPKRAIAKTVSDTPQELASERLDWNRCGGTGLGLAIVRQIVEAHNGSVSANNHPETGGAWLKVELPQQQMETNPVPIEF